MSKKGSVAKSSKIRIRQVASAGILTAMAVILMFADFPLTFLLMPDFLKFDFSELPILIGAFSLGPVFGIAMEFVKNLFHCLITKTAFTGEISNFIINSVYVGTASLVYMLRRTRKGAIASLITASVVVTAFCAPFNYYFTIPLMSKLYGLPISEGDFNIISMVNAINSRVVDLKTLVIWVFIPFNLLKTVVISFITFWIYKPISKIINKTYAETHKK